MNAPPAKEALIIDNRIIDDAELIALLKHEAAATGLTVAEVYREEMDALKELDRITPPLEELIERGHQGGAPAYMAEKCDRA